jgi:hypothetical protein
MYQQNSNTGNTGKNQTAGNPSKKKEPIMQYSIRQAAQRFYDLKTRAIHPKGSFDKAGRFYLDTTYSCCAVRSPSRSYPYSQMVHGRTAEHVAHETGINASLIRSYARIIEREERGIESDDCFCQTKKAKVFA